MDDDEATVTVRFTGEALVTLRTLAAVRGESLLDVLRAALGHEEWITTCSIRGARVYAEGQAYRDELELPEPPAGFRDAPASR